MVEENISQEFRVKNIDEIRNYFLEKKIEQNELKSRKHKNVCTTLNYIEPFILVSTITGCISISTFASLLGISKEIMSSTIGLKFLQ